MSVPPLPERAADVAGTFQRSLDLVQSYLRPATFAALQERVWRWEERLSELTERLRPSPPPTVVRPGALPQPLNPFYFARPAPPSGLRGTGPVRARRARGPESSHG